LPRFYGPRCVDDDVAGCDLLNSYYTRDSAKRYHYSTCICSAGVLAWAADNPCTGSVITVIYWWKS